MMIHSKKIIRVALIFIGIFSPVLGLSFLAHTPFHQLLFFFGFIIACGAAYYGSSLVAERDRLNREVFLMSYELKKAKEALESCLAVDTKTHVYYERLLGSRITEECDRARRYNRPLSFLLIGADGISELGKTHGMLIPEVMMQELTQFIKESMRGVDIIIRDGLDRLVAILPETSVNPAQIAAERIRFAVEKKVFKIDEKEIHLTISIGIIGFDATIHRKKEDIINSLIRALDFARQKGLNHTAILSSEME